MKVHIKNQVYFENSSLGIFERNKIYVMLCYVMVSYTLDVVRKLRADRAMFIRI